MLYLFSALALCTAAGLSLLAFRIGDRRGYKRCADREPYLSLDMMIAEHAMVKEKVKMVERHMQMIGKTLQPAMRAIEAGMYRTMLERGILKDHALRTFINTCEGILQKHNYEIRSGPWTRHAAAKYIGKVLDSLYLNQITIAEGVEQLLEHVYFDPPKPAAKIPVEPEIEPVIK